MILIEMTREDLESRTDLTPEEKDELGRAA